MSILAKFMPKPTIRDVPAGDMLLKGGSLDLDPRDSQPLSPRTERIDDLNQLRRWALNHPIVFAAIKQLTNPLLAQSWTVRPKNPAQASQETLLRAEMARRVLERPNPSPYGMNQSFSELLKVALTDTEIADIGCFLPQRDGYRRIRYLHHTDPALVEFRPRWKSDADGPRYKLYSDDRKRYRWLQNEELIVLSYNPVSWDERGIPALRVLQDTLEADFDVFLAQWQKQKREAPSGILNMPKAARKVVDAVETYYRTRIEGRQTIGVANLPAETNFIRIGNSGATSEWVHFTDTVVRRVATAMDLTPTDLGWSQMTHQATAEFESEKSAQRAIKPRSDRLADILNTEFISSWGDDIEFAWTGIGSKDETRLASVISTLSATGAWGKNELRAMRGDPLLHYDDPVEQALADDPIFQNRDQPPVPLRLYAAQLRSQYPAAAAAMGSKLIDTPPQTIVTPIPPSSPTTPRALPPPTLARSLVAAGQIEDDEMALERDRYALTLDAITTEEWSRS